MTEVAEAPKNDEGGLVVVFAKVLIQIALLIGALGPITILLSVKAWGSDSFLTRVVMSLPSQIFIVLVSVVAIPVVGALSFKLWRSF